MNKNIKIIGGIVLAALIGLIIYKLYFADDHEEGHVHDDGSVHGSEQVEGVKKEDSHEGEVHDEHEGEDEHGHEKMVELNEAQFKNAAIDTGWLYKVASAESGSCICTISRCHQVYQSYRRTICKGWSNYCHNEQYVV
jgi:hypothetical protein